MNDFPVMQDDRTTTRRRLRGGSPKRVLVAEDERRTAELLRARLKAHGFAVDVAYDGAEALCLARTNHYSAIVVDLMLPVVDGARVCADLRAAQVSTQVLVLGPDGSPSHAGAALDSGADHYLARPLQLDALVALVRSVHDVASTRSAVLR